MANPGIGGGNARTKLIPGIYNYCDSWCSRCRFTQRCRSFQMRAAFERAAETGLDPDAAVEAVLDEGEDMRGPVVHDAQYREFLELIDRANRPMTPAEEAEFNRRIKEEEERLNRHPLVVDSREYSTVALQILEAISAMTQQTDDPILAAALETIGWFAYFIPAKTRRALHGLIDAEVDDDMDDGALSDANGSAKIARLAIAESLDAWRTVLQATPAAGDGVPEAMIRRLSALDAALAVAFPGAERFRRPGFDDESS